jgi:hypothetical protein
LCFRRRILLNQPPSSENSWFCLHEITFPSFRQYFEQKYYRFKTGLQLIVHTCHNFLKHIVKNIITIIMEKDWVSKLNWRSSFYYRIPVIKKCLYKSLIWDHQGLGMQGWTSLNSTQLCKLPNLKLGHLDRRKKNPDARFRPI